MSCSPRCRSATEKIGSPLRRLPRISEAINTLPREKGSRREEAEEAKFPFGGTSWGCTRERAMSLGSVVLCWGFCQDGCREPPPNNMCRSGRRAPLANEAPNANARVPPCGLGWAAPKKTPGAPPASDKVPRLGDRPPFDRDVRGCLGPPTYVLPAWSVGVLSMRETSCRESPQSRAIAPTLIPSAACTRKIEIRDVWRMV